MAENIFKPYLDKVDDEESRKKVEAVFAWIEQEFPDLKREVKWSTPLYTNNGTYIIGVKSAKKHFSINPEAAGIEKFSRKIKSAGYTHEQMTYKIKYSDDVDYDLLREVIEYNIEDKKDTETFWR